MTNTHDLDIYGADGELDPLKFVLHLRQSSQQAAVIASVRPTWANLAEVLVVLRTTANRLLLDGDDDHQFTPRNLLEPAPGSRAMAERQAQVNATLNAANGLINELIGEYLVATSDHLWAMCVLLNSDPPFRPLLATGRILLDAGAHVRYLLDPTVDLRERVTRAANIELDSIREELKDITDDEGGQGDELIARRAELLAAGDADGHPRVVSKKGEAQESFAPPLIPTSDMANLVLGGTFGQQIWRLASSVVHAKDRSVLEFVGGRGDADLSGPGLGKTMSVPFIASCLVVMTESYKDVAEYIGRSSPALEEAIQSVFRTLEAMTGKYDDELLDRAGIDRTGWA